MELDALDSLREMLGDDVFAVREALNSDAHSHLDQLLGEVGTHRGIAVRTCVAEGNPLATIAAEADALDACMVVLGARGESLLRRALLGPTAALYWDRRQPVWCASRRGGRYWW